MQLKDHLCVGVRSVVKKGHSRYYCVTATFTTAVVVYSHPLKESLLKRIRADEAGYGEWGAEEKTK